jgi:hypothetical protein
MSRRASFKMSDLTRALKGVAQAGLKARRAVIEDGRIVIVFEGDEEPMLQTPLDHWRAGRGARAD